jgi:hypothetical protein
MVFNWRRQVHDKYLKTSSFSTEMLSILWEQNRWNVNKYGATGNPLLGDLDPDVNLTKSYIGYI